MQLEAEPAYPNNSSFAFAMLSFDMLEGSSRSSSGSMQPRWALPVLHGELARVSLTFRAFKQLALSLRRASVPRTVLPRLVS